MRSLHLLLIGAGLVVVSAIGTGCIKKSAEEAHLKETSRAPSDPSLVSESAGAHQSDADEAQRGPADKPGPIERKIIFTAELRLTVSDFAKAEEQLQKLLQSHKAYIAKAEVSGAAGGSRRGTWKIRVAVAKFGDLREAIKKLGDLVRYTSDAQDVTEEYFDLVTRIKNKEAELDALHKLFDKGSGKIEDVVVVQREVSRAQSELEQMKGRQRLLENLTELTTITVYLQERGTYLPPERQAFGSAVETTFFDSIDLLLLVARTTALVAVALAPWLPVLAVPVVAGWLARRRKQLVKAAAPTSTSQ